MSSYCARSTTADSSICANEMKPITKFLEELVKKYDNLGTPLLEYVWEVEGSEYLKTTPSDDVCRKAHLYRKYNEEFKKELLKRIEIDEKEKKTCLSSLKKAVSDSERLLSYPINNLSYYIQEVCANRDFNSLKWLYETGLLQKYDYTCGFKVCCSRGYDDMAKQVYSLSKGNLDLHDQDDYNLYWVCENNDKEFADWILSLDKLSTFHVPEEQYCHVTKCWSYVRKLLEK